MDGIAVGGRHHGACSKEIIMHRPHELGLFHEHFGGPKRRWFCSTSRHELLPHAAIKDCDHDTLLCCCWRGRFSATPPLALGTCRLNIRAIAIRGKRAKGCADRL